MGGLELLAVVVFFLIGYWLVDYVWPKKKEGKAAGDGSEFGLETGLGVTPEGGRADADEQAKE